MNNLIERYCLLNPKSDYHTMSKMFGISPLYIHKIFYPYKKPDLDYLVKSHIYDDYFHIQIYGYGNLLDNHSLNLWYKTTIPCFSRGSAVRFAEQKISIFLEDYLVV